MRTATASLCTWFRACLFAFLVGASARSDEPGPEQILPANTLGFVKVTNADAFRHAFEASAMVKMWNDPALGPFQKALRTSAAEVIKALEEDGFFAIYSIPQSQLAVAELPSNRSDLPHNRIWIIDVGDNDRPMLALLDRLTTGDKDLPPAKATTEKVGGLTLHIVRSAPSPKLDEPVPPYGYQPEPVAPKAVEPGFSAPASEPPSKPIAAAVNPGAERNDEVDFVWTRDGSRFLVGSDVASIRDIATHRKGRKDSLAAQPGFAKVRSQVNTPQTQVFWYVDIPAVLNSALGLTIPFDQESLKATLEKLGVNAIKAIGGAVALGGQHENLARTFLFVPGPKRGLLDLRAHPISLEPEPWVPETVCSYQTLSLNGDAAYEVLKAVLDLHQTGMLEDFDEDLVDPKTNKPFSLRKDFFGHLGDRVTILTDYKKPVTSNNIRQLVVIALKDPSGIEATLSRILAMADVKTSTRSLSGATIHQVNTKSAFGSALGGTLSLNQGFAWAVTDHKFLVSYGPDFGLLEQVLDAKGQQFGQSESYRKVAASLPKQGVGMSVSLPHDPFKAAYRLLRSHQLPIPYGYHITATENDSPLPLLDMTSPLPIPVDKLPPFTALAKYLSLMASQSTMTDDGILFTSFSLRRDQP